MFAKRDRLSRASFPTVARAGKRLHTAHFAFTSAPGATGYAVVVSKQVARLSVTRHRLKRQVQAALRELSKGQKLPSSLVVTARTDAPKLPYKEIQAELEAGISRIA